MDVLDCLRMTNDGAPSVMAAPHFSNFMPRMVGPFVLIAHGLPMRFAANELKQDVDVRPHPHIGLATLSYLFSGEMTHRDGLGVRQVIRPGEVNWMNSGAGIVHSERFEGVRAHGGQMHALQIWVALPEAAEEAAPSFHHFGADALPTLSAPGVAGRVIAGEAFGLASPVPVASPMHLVHLSIGPGARFLAPSGHEERAIYVMRGSLVTERGVVNEGQRAFLAPEDDFVFSAGEGGAEILAFGGAALGPRFLWWNLVSSRKERIEDAKADWKAGRFKLPADDDGEFIPLPEDYERPLMAFNAP